MNVKTLLESLPETVSPADKDFIERAYRVAQKAHAGQKRASGEPYINHCLAVAAILQELGAPVPVIAAALLHDTVEDTSVTLADVRRDFGDEVAKLVDGVTKLTHLPRVTRRPGTDKAERASRTELAKETLRKTFLAMGDDVRVVLIKLADRLHNMRTLSHLPPEKQVRIAEETMEIFAPLANRLGIWQMKWELEDLGFRYVMPERYKEIAEHIAKRRVDRESELEEITQRVRDLLSEAKIQADVAGRPKHLYSIFRKMERKGVPFDEVYDVRGVRILVESIQGCYLALGTIHNEWKPIPGTFDDYIATPKDNFYQSLHTAVVYDDGRTLELQIRTPEMHENAELGIAAHWRYKEGRQREDGYEQRVHLAAAFDGVAAGYRRRQRLRRSHEVGSLRGSRLRIYPARRYHRPSGRFDPHRFRLSHPHRYWTPMPRREGQRKASAAGLHASDRRFGRNPDRQAWGTEPRLAEPKPGNGP